MKSSPAISRAAVMSLLAISLLPAWAQKITVATQLDDNGHPTQADISIANAQPETTVQVLAVGVQKGTKNKITLVTKSFKTDKKGAFKKKIDIPPRLGDEDAFGFLGVTCFAKNGQSVNTNFDEQGRPIQETRIIRKSKDLKDGRFSYRLPNLVKNSRLEWVNPKNATVADVKIDQKTATISGKLVDGVKVGAVTIDIFPPKK